MRIVITQIFVHDQQKAHRFYTQVLGFQTKEDVPVGDDRWLTVTSPEDPTGPELLLEPARHPAVGPFQLALYTDGIPAASFGVDDVHAAHAELRAKGVRFAQEPTDLGPVTVAVLDDTCGNLIQLAARK